jgi:putative ABC transport system permease protein
MYRHAHLVLRNALRNRRRSALTVLSIGVSFCLLGVLLSLYHSFFFSTPAPEAARRLIVRHRVSLTNYMPASYMERIRAVPGVADVMIFQWFGGVYKDSRDLKNFFGRLAIEASKFRGMYPEYKVDDAEFEAFAADRAGCLVGRPLAARHGFRLGERIVLKGDIFPVDLQLTIRGFYDRSRDNESLFFHQEYLRESLPPGMRDRIGTFGVLIESAERVTEAAAEIDKLFENAPEPTLTETERAFELSFLSYLGNVKAFLLGLSGALTFTLLLVAANTMAMSVRERVRETGILKTLGYTGRTIAGIVLGESALIALAGGLLGVALASGLCALLRLTPILFVDLKELHVPASVGAVCLAGALLIGVAGSLPPAWHSARQPIIEALRKED